MSLQDEIDQKRRDIHTEGYPMSVGELLNLYRDDELDIHPEFQRFFRWSPEQKSRFVESLLLGIPVPSIFVHQRHSDGVWDVIDGLQRLSTIFEFVGVLKDNDGDVKPPLSLKGTEYLPSLAGITWEGDSPTLSQPQQRIIKRAAIDLKIITRESDDEAKFDLFQRLNTGGSQLSDQEVRNCLLIMEKPEYYRWVAGLRARPDFQSTVAVSDRAQDEQYDMELVLRFLALKDAGDDALRRVGDMKDFLDRTSRASAQDDAYNWATEAEQFQQTFEILNEALADEAFRRYDSVRGRFVGGFSVSAYEAITAGVYSHLEAWLATRPDDRAQALRDRAQALWSDPEFRTNSGSGIRASGRIPKTVPRGRAIFTP